MLAHLGFWEKSVPTVSGFETLTSWLAVSRGPLLALRIHSHSLVGGHLLSPKPGMEGEILLTPQIALPPSTPSIPPAGKGSLTLEAGVIRLVSAGRTKIIFYLKV